MFLFWLFSIILRFYFFVNISIIFPCVYSFFLMVSSFIHSKNKENTCDVHYYQIHLFYFSELEFIIEFDKLFFRTYQIQV